jgi:hypothetical protein
MTYTGEWKEGMRHGKGELKWASGDSYIGEFEENLRSGTVPLLSCSFTHTHFL